MSVILETSLGDIVIDLFTDLAPKCCENFLKLCKTKYYNYSPIHTVHAGFSLQTGDPLGPLSKESDGGSSIWGLLDAHTTSRPSPKRTFKTTLNSKLKHKSRGTVSMACASVPADDDTEVREAASQFLITLGEDIDYLDGKAAPFGKVVEGFDTLEKINAAFVDNEHRPLKDIRIRHTIVLDEADIADPSGLDALIPPSSPVPTAAQLATVRIADDEDLSIEQDPAELEKLRREREAKQQAVTLELVGDLPFAEVAPPENVLFVCKLNPVTDDESLDMIFGRFGKILSCEVIKDKNTGDSLQYAFIEYEDKGAAETAYNKMQNVLIDDSRIHVDFSQSVSRLADVWRGEVGQRRGGRGGFGGIMGLEKKRQYRAEGEDRRWNREQVKRGDMLFEKEGREKDGERDESRRKDDHRSRRSPSPRRERERHNDRGERDRYRERDDRDDRDRQRRVRSRDRDSGRGDRRRR